MSTADTRTPSDVPVPGTVAALRRVRARERAALQAEIAQLRAEHAQLVEENAALRAALGRGK